MTVNHTNGSIALTNVSGRSTPAPTNGRVRATLARVMAEKPMAFTVA